jgi:imidazolonepropionase-like amidohydrolase
MRTGRAAAALAALLACLLAAPLHGKPDGGKPGKDRRDRDRSGEPPAPPPWHADPFPSTYAPPPAPDLLIRHATVLDGAGQRLDDSDVLLAGGKVRAIGRGLANPGAAREIDARGRWVTPGVIDVHSHDGTFVLPLTAIDSEAGDVAELSDLNTADIRIETGVNPQDMAFARALQGGVTTLQILPGSSPIFGGHAVILKPVPATHVAAMKFPGAPTGFKMTCGENPKAHGAATHRGATSREGVVAFTRRAFLDAQDYARDWHRFAGGKGGPPRRDLKKEALAGILDGRLRVQMHCYRSDDLATALAVAREFGFTIAAFHHATEAYKVPALLRAAGTCAAVWSDWWGFKMEAQDAVRANAPLLQQAGACVAMHSDSPGSGQRLNTEAAKAAAAGRRLGIELPPEELIRWTTSTPARILGMADRIGTLAPGYNADLVVWSGDPFSIYSKADLVLIDGAIRFDRAAPPRPASDFDVGRPTMRRQ